MCCSSPQTFPRVPRSDLRGIAVASVELKLVTIPNIVFHFIYCMTRSAEAKNSLRLYATMPHYGFTEGNGWLGFEAHVVQCVFMLV